MPLLLKPITSFQFFKKQKTHSNLIRWDKTGESFLVLDRKKVSTVLSHYFRSQKLSSFIRQLSMYRFKKDKNESGILRFSHPFFKRDCKFSLRLIRRQSQTSIPKEKVRYDLIDFLVAKLENKILKKKNNCGRLERVFNLLKHLRLYCNIYGKNIPIFVDKFSNRVCFFFPWLYKRFQKEFEEVEKNVLAEWRGETKGAVIHKKGEEIKSVKSLSVDLFNKIILFYSRRFAREECFDKKGLIRGEWEKTKEEEEKNSWSDMSH